MSHKVCSACAEKIQAKAVKCKHCGTDVSEVKARYSLGEQFRIGCALLFAFSAFSTCLAKPHPPAEEVPAPSSAPMDSAAEREAEAAQVRAEAAQRAAAAAEQREQLAQERRQAAEEAKPKLKVLAYTWSREHGYITLEGQVKNLTDEPLEGVQAVGSFYKGESFVTSDTGMVEYQPLLPKQTSPGWNSKRSSEARSTPNFPNNALKGQRIGTVT